MTETEEHDRLTILELAVELHREDRDPSAEAVIETAEKFLHWVRTGELPVPAEAPDDEEEDHAEAA